MNDGAFYLYGNLACNVVVAISAVWLLTDRRFHRLMRACHALLAAGALVNVAGMLGAIFGFQNMDYGHVWPGELVANFGTGGLLVFRIWQTSRSRRGAGSQEGQQEPSAY